MNTDLGVWTYEDCALVLIDYQKEMFEVIRSETSADLVETHVRLLAKTAKAYGVPIVLSTVGVAAGFNGPTIPPLLAELGIAYADARPDAFSVKMPGVTLAIWTFEAVCDKPLLDTVTFASPAATPGGTSKSTSLGAT